MAACSSFIRMIYQDMQIRIPGPTRAAVISSATLTMSAGPGALLNPAMIMGRLPGWITLVNPLLVLAF
jgi:hypothetical protein